MTTATPTRQSSRSKARDPRTVELSARPDGTFGALSSDGMTIYTVRLVCGSWRCQCPGFAARETCCHALAAAQARTCYWCDRTGADVEVYLNGWDNNAELALCSACFTPREVK